VTDAADPNAASAPGDEVAATLDGPGGRADVPDPDGPWEPADAIDIAQDGGLTNDAEADAGDDEGDGLATDTGAPGPGDAAAAPDVLDAGLPPPADAGPTPDAPNSCAWTACPGGCFDTTSDPQHCGSCSRACPHGPHSEPTCAGGACGIACTGGALDCDREPANGCECTGAIANGSLLCNANGTCGHICDQGYVDCGGTACSCGAGNRCLSDQTCGACRSALQPCRLGSDCCSGSCGVNLTCL
jgi:hypothetical protein